MHHGPARHRRERGITFLGALILIGFMGIFVYAGIRLIPLYLEYMNVVKALDGLKSQVDASSSQQQIRRAVEKQFDIDDVKSIDWRDLEVTRDHSTWTVHAGYEARAPFISNIGFIVHFDKTVTLAPPSGA